MKVVQALLSELDRLDRILKSRRGMRLRVACPSQEFSRREMSLGVGRWRSCVRGLWESLTLSREPDLALVMVQAPPIPVSVMSYLFDIQQGRHDGSLEHRARHAMVEIADDRSIHLSEKLLTSQDIVARIRSTIQIARRNRHQVEGLSCFSSSDRMAEIAEILDLELLETPPESLRWGGKAGSREIFRRAGVPHPPGTYSPLQELPAVADEISVLSRRHGIGPWVLKIDHGFGSSHGNAVVNIASLEPAAIKESLLKQLQPLNSVTSRDEFLQLIEADGVVIERYLEILPGTDVRYPSALGYIRRSAEGVEVEILGSHEQVLDPEHSFGGCRFPASEAYRGQVLQMTREILDQLVTVGVRGHVGIDFLARASAKGSPGWALDALEINLRQTGTTHPNRTVRALVTGRWTEDGRLVGPQGEEIVYTGTDGLISPQFRGITGPSLVSALRRSTRLSFDQRRCSGVVPHLWTTLEDFGKVGATFIGRSTSECERLEGEFVSLLTALRG